jgi:hypothetical protein
MSRKYWMVAALFTLTTSAGAQGTMKHDMTQGAMKHDMAAMPSLASMILRADSLVGRTEKMMRMTADTMTHKMMMPMTADSSAHKMMMMDHAASDSPQAMASGLHAMATGLRAVLQHMDAMHRAGMKMEGDAGTAMMDVHRRMNTMLGELDKTLLATDLMHAKHANSGK